MKEKDKTSTPLSELGRIKLLERYLPMFDPQKTGISFFENAVVRDQQGKKNISSLKLFTEGVHFNLMYFPLMHLGYKTVVAAIMDIYAMNAMTASISINMAVSGKFYVEHLDEFFEGVRLACGKYNIALKKLDITTSVTGLTIAIGSEGYADKKISSQNGAKPNDLICVTGNFGAAYMGLQLLERERRVFESSGGAQPELENYKYIIERQLKPEAHKDIITLFHQSSIDPSAMTTVSEGLASGILMLCKSSGTGCKIFAEKIPVDAETAAAAEEMNLEPLTCALNGGEDYELLFTIPLSEFNKISSRPEIKAIGHMVTDPSEKILIFESGSTVPLKAQGWEE